MDSHQKPDQHMHYAERELSSLQQFQSLSTSTLRGLPMRCQQEFTGPAVAPLAWYRRNVLPAELYAAVI